MTNTSKRATGIRKGKINLQTLTGPRMQKLLKSLVVSIFRYGLIICLAYMILYPLLQMISVAFTHPYDIGSPASVWVPANITLDNFIVAGTILDYGNAVLYTLGSTVIVMFLQMVNAALAGYSFARLKFRGSKILFFMVLLTIIVPPSSLMLPQYVYFRNFDLFGIFELITGNKLNLLGKPVSLLILSVLGQGLSSGLFIYIFIQFFRGLPKELEEAAYVDGAGFLRTFIGIVIPTAKPSFITVGVLSFVWNWNDTYFPRLFNPTSKYLGIRLANLSGVSGGTTVIQQAIGNVLSKLDPEIVRLTTTAYDSVILRVCALLIIVPLVVFFLAIQKQFVEGVERSGIVG